LKFFSCKTKYFRCYEKQLLIEIYAFAEARKCFYVNIALYFAQVRKFAFQVVVSRSYSTKPSVRTCPIPTRVRLFSFNASSLKRHAPVCAVLLYEQRTTERLNDMLWKVLLVFRVIRYCAVHYDLFGSD
ncbi:hypothetical protein Tcan_00508, partial [Toxocara canis]